MWKWPYNTMDLAPSLLVSDPILTWTWQQCKVPGLILIWNLALFIHGSMKSVTLAWITLTSNIAQQCTLMFIWPYPDMYVEVILIVSY